MTQQMRQPRNLPYLKGRCDGGPIHGTEFAYTCSLAVVATIGEKIGLVDPATAAKGHAGRMGRYMFNFQRPGSWLWRGWY